MVNVFVVALIGIGFGSESKTDSSTSTPPVFKSEPHHYQNTNNGGWYVCRSIMHLLYCLCDHVFLYRALNCYACVFK